TGGKIGKELKVRRALASCKRYTVCYIKNDPAWLYVPNDQRNSQPRRTRFDCRRMRRPNEWKNIAAGSMYSVNKNVMLIWIGVRYRINSSDINVTANWVDGSFNGPVERVYDAEVRKTRKHFGGLEPRSCIARYREPSEVASLAGNALVYRNKHLTLRT